MVRACVSGVVLSLAFCGAASAQYLGPTPYLSAADSPLLIPSTGVFFVEDFEDDVFTPGLTAIGGGRVGPGGFTDSVDADDGAIDGSGAGGSSYYSLNASSSLEFRFDAAAIGGLPTHAGVVWTDVGNVLSGPVGVSDVFFEAFDALGESAGVFGPFTLGDGAAASATAEDRFLGIVNPAGISRIVISMPNSVDWEVDHVQYGRIPAPGASALLLVAGVMAARRRRV